MKNNNGITLIAVIMTVILLSILAGLGINYGIESYNSSKVVKFESYMKVIQKKVDILVEEKVDYTSLGTTLSSTQKNKLKAIIDEDSNVETTKEVVDTETKLRYFSSSDIKKYFEIEDVVDEIVVNFANREVISLNGIEKDETMIYVEAGLY